MVYIGSCKCDRWRVDVRLTVPLEELNPRVCDCHYCQTSYGETNSASILSDPNMLVTFIGEGVSIEQNGDRLANFFHCEGCKTLLAVGRDINGQLRGAVNANLLQDINKLGHPIQIQPRLLSANEKLERWNKLWGQLSGFYIHSKLYKFSHILN